MDQNFGILKIVIVVLVTALVVGGVFYLLLLQQTTQFNEKIAALENQVTPEPSGAFVSSTDFTNLEQRVSALEQKPAPEASASQDVIDMGCFGLMGDFPGLSSADDALRLQLTNKYCKQFAY